MRAEAPYEAGEGRRIRVVGLVAHPGGTERAVRRALLAAGAEIAAVLAAADERSFGERAQALREARADLVLGAATDRGDADRIAPLTEALRYACAAQRPPPIVIVATGDDGAAARLTRLVAPLTAELVPDPRRAEGRAAVVERVRALRGPALRDERLEELAARTRDERRAAVLVVDVTERSTSLVLAGPGAEVVAVHARPLGIGAADRLVEGAGLERMRRWIPWQIDAPTLLDRAFNRSRWPGALPTDRETRALEVALAHEAVARIAAEAERVGVAAAMRSATLVLLSGRLASLEDGDVATVLATLALGGHAVAVRAGAVEAPATA